LKAADYYDINSEMVDTPSAREVGRVNGGGVTLLGGPLPALRRGEVRVGAGRHPLEGRGIALGAPAVPVVREDLVPENHAPGLIRLP